MAKRLAVMSLSSFPSSDSEPVRRGALRPATLTSVRRRMNGHAAARLFRASDIFVTSALAAGFGQADQGEFLVTGVLLAVGALQILALYAAGAYRLDLRAPLRFVRIALTLGVATLFGLVVVSVLHQPIALYAVLIQAGALLTLNRLWAAMTANWRRKGQLTPNLMILGATPGARQLIERLTKSREAAVLGVFDDRLDRAPKSIGGVPVLGDSDALIAHRLTPYVDRIVVTVPRAAQARVSALVERLAVLPNEIVLLLDGDGGAMERIANLPLEYKAGHRSRAVPAFFKRVQDIVVGVAALAVFSPVFLLTAIAVKLDSPGPIFFRQRRHGFQNEEILVWKFRSMRRETADATASRQVIYGDDRVTRVGRIIRRTSIDELPQLFNVLKGEMSLVGPRPHAIGMKTGDVESAALVAYYAHRHRMKPGMTGWAAIHGSRGPVDTPELVRSRVRLDVEYIERQSFWLDLYIMAMTLPCLMGDRELAR
jgi:Undecaprenyl-phosphate glucose phosphotransferase